MLAVAKVCQLSMQSLGEFHLLQTRFCETWTLFAEKVRLVPACRGRMADVATIQQLAAVYAQMYKGLAVTRTISV